MSIAALTISQLLDISSHTICCSLLVYVVLITLLLVIICHSLFLITSVCWSYTSSFVTHYQYTSMDKSFLLCAAFAVCSRMHTYAHVCTPNVTNAHVCSRMCLVCCVYRMLTYGHVCSRMCLVCCVCRMLTYAHLCSRMCLVCCVCRMLTYAHVM